MAGVDEAAYAKPPLGSDVAEGIKALSATETVIFNLYVKVVLPLDGYVFWVRASSLSAAALYNNAQFNQVVLNQAQTNTVNVATSITAVGSFHYATELRQEETETFSVNKIVFTSLVQIDEFNSIGPNEMYLAEYEGILFGFSSHGNYYVQADTWHYNGHAVYSDMMTQIIDDARVFDTKSLIVSNSLPFWLQLNNVINGGGLNAAGIGQMVIGGSPVGNSLQIGAWPPWPIRPNYPTLVLYPSFLVEQNLTNHFGSVHIPPELTRPIAAAPAFGPTYSRQQLVEDTVRITLYGLRNDEVLDFIDFVAQLTLDTGAVGLMNIPIPHDEKRGQPELQAIAQKKTVEFRVNYLQTRMNTLARQLIKQATETIIVNAPSVTNIVV